MKIRPLSEVPELILQRNDPDGVIDGVAERVTSSIIEEQRNWTIGIVGNGCNSGKSFVAWHLYSHLHHRYQVASVVASRIHTIENALQVIDCRQREGSSAVIIECVTEGSFDSGDDALAYMRAMDADVQRISEDRLSGIDTWIALCSADQKFVRQYVPADFLIRNEGASIKGSC